MKKFYKSVTKIVDLLLHYPDPVKSCNLYKDKGCSHVDGLVCDFPKCSMNNQYNKESDTK